MIAIVITTGTNTALILSASLATGAFDAEASSTSAIICESVESLACFSHLTLAKPPADTLALITLSPTALSTGMLSPVSADWSTVQFPSIRTPSHGTDQPALSRNTSPTITFSAGTSTSSLSRITTAVLGARLTSLFTALAVLSFERASIYFPTVISVSIMPHDS